MEASVNWQAVSREFLLEHAARGDPRAAQILRGLLLSEQASEYLAADGAAARVAIGICTAQRSRMLAHCLEAISLQIIPRGIEVHLVVVDNEAEPNNRHLLQDFSARCPFPVHYVHEPRRGIPQARNAVLEKCRELGVDWIAFTDDDCWTSPAWLVGLLESAVRHKADVVYGRREFILPPSSWPLHLEQARFRDGQELRTASTHNVLFAGWLIRPREQAGMRFDERLAHGEDTDFFHRAVQRGARIVYAREPAVFETVPIERATLRFHVGRAYYYAASKSDFHRRHRGTATALAKLLDRLVVKAPVAIARLIAAPLVWPVSEPAFRHLLAKGSVRLVGIAGATAGILGFIGNPYRVIDGS